MLHSVHDVPWPKQAALDCLLHSYMTTYIVRFVCILFQVVRMVDDGYRLPPPPGCPREIYHLMIQCW